MSSQSLACRLRALMLTAALLSCSVDSTVWAQSIEEGTSRTEGTAALLRALVSVEHEQLGGANRLSLTSSGRFLYVAPWRERSIASFKIEAPGKLEFYKSFSNPLLDGVIQLDLSHDERRLAAICLQSNTIVLFERDPASGDITPDGFSRAKLSWPVSVTFSPDSKFLYVCDARGAGNADHAASCLVVFRVSPSGGLQEIQRIAEPYLVGLRDFVIEPSGTSGYACCCIGGSLITYSRNVEDGRLAFVDSAPSQRVAATLLDGVHAVAFNKDASRLYVVSGRFQGASGVTVFARGRSGRLHLECELRLPEKAFAGGNHIVVTADERHVIVSGTTGDSIAVLKHDPQAHRLALLSVLKDSLSQNLQGASGLVLDAAEQHLFVAAENGSAITVFKLDPDFNAR